MDFMGPSHWPLSGWCVNLRRQELSSGFPFPGLYALELSGGGESSGFRIPHRVGSSEALSPVGNGPKMSWKYRQQFVQSSKSLISGRFRDNWQSLQYPRTS